MFMVHFHTSGRPTNPEDVQGIKEAISILENQEPSITHQINNNPDGLHIITPQPLIDERNNQKIEYSTNPSPVYRSNRSNNVTIIESINNMASNPQESNSEYRLVTVNADYNFNNSAVSNSAESNSTSTENVRRHRRRLTLLSNSTTEKSTTTTNIPQSTTNIPIAVTTPLIEIIKQDIQPIESLTEIRQEKLTDQLDTIKYLENPSPVRRFYRSSAEKTTGKDQIEMAMVDKERVQIVRPTTGSRLVGRSPTQKAAIDRLDAAVLGKPVFRVKKQTLTIVTPQRYHRSDLNNAT